MAAHQFGDILLLSFPFTNNVGSKRRPALVLLDTNDGDVLVARVTTQISRTEFDATLADWKQAGLLDVSVVRLDKLATLERTLVERRVGALTPQDKLVVVGVVRKLLAAIR